MPSEAVPEVRRDTTDRAHATAAIAALPAWDLGEEAVSEAVVAGAVVAAGAVVGADK
jgi:hypothetical protein